MRSSKQRSRGKNNRNRSPGNNVSRVFDSSGPEGKVRGTPQQIIDKYQMLTRDSQLSNDRVAAENFQQHAEHYVRLLGDAQREADARRIEQETQQRERQAQRDARHEPRHEPRQDGRQDSRQEGRNEPHHQRRNDPRDDNRNDPRDDNRNDPRDDTRKDPRHAPRNVVSAGPVDVVDPSDAPQPDLPAFITEEHMVAKTPEAASENTAQPAAAVEKAENADNSEKAEKAEKEKKVVRKPRRRKPVAEKAVAENAAPENTTKPESPEAAE